MQGARLALSQARARARLYAAPYPTWSRTAAGGNGQGDPDGDSWTPAETDFTLQNGDKCVSWVPPLRKPLRASHAD